MAKPSSVPRHAIQRVRDALEDTRIVALQGPRQAGKSTLCSGIAAETHMSAITLDDETPRATARRDPTGFLAGLTPPVFIDELQRAPELLLALKADVDRHPATGRYLVTGSANLLLDPRVGDSLAGRIERVPLRPFTQAELHRVGVPQWLDDLWDGAPPPPVVSDAVGATSHAQAIAVGGFPAAIDRTEHRRRAWFDDYLESLVTRDVPDLVDVRRPDLLPVLLQHLAAASGQPLRVRPIATALSIDEKTVRSYIRLLELLYIVVGVPAWTPGVASRVVRTPRMFVEDAGVLAHVLDADRDRIASDDGVTGRAYETWVAMELARLLPHTEVAPRLRHWRTHHGDEVDIVLENRRGHIIGIEIKAGATIGHGDTRGLRKLRALVPDRFVAGLVLCTIEQTTPLADKTWAVPISALWTETAC